MAGVEDQVRKQLKEKAACYLIDPRTSKWIGYWDAATSLALIWTALVTPAEVALFESATKYTATLFLINRFIDCLFTVDMVVQFCMMVEIKTHAADGGTQWSASPKTIAQTSVPPVTNHWRVSSPWWPSSRRKLKEASTVLYTCASEGVARGGEPRRRGKRFEGGCVYVPRRGCATRARHRPGRMRA